MSSGSVCPKCPNTTFETVVEYADVNKFPLQFVRCRSCKCVVGVMDDFNIGSLIVQLAQKLDVPFH